MKFKSGLGIPWVSQQRRLAYLEKELVLGKGNRVIKRPMAENTQVWPFNYVEDMV